MTYLYVCRYTCNQADDDVSKNMRQTSLLARGFDLLVLYMSSLHLRKSSQFIFVYGQLERAW